MEISNTVYNFMTDEPAVFRKNILQWYDRHRRVLPWRALSGDQVDPYLVWLSEVMLQQTTVQAVIAYFLKFTEKWPNVHALAAAENDEVMSAWAGLGYYARARNLHKCAKIVSKDLLGVFPCDEAALKSLPGIGDYTSAAIMSIAFDMPAVVIDGNVDRVMARYHAIDRPFPAGKGDVRRYAEFYAKGFSDRPSDYAQALMDLGAIICTPKSPCCTLCPLNYGCAAYQKGEAELYPKKLPKKQRPKRYGHVYWITNGKGQVLLHRRPNNGLLGGMYGLPTSDWLEGMLEIKHHTDFSNFDFVVKHEKVEHVFTHFSLTLFVNEVHLQHNYAGDFSEDFVFYDVNDIRANSFPTVFKKAIKLFL